MKSKVTVPFKAAHYSPIKSCQRRSPCRIFLSRMCIISVILAILLFIGIYVVIPVTFMLSINFQTSMVLPRWSIPESNFTDFKSHGLKGVRNFYVKLRNNITLGVWHILPEEYSELENPDYELLLNSSSWPVLLFFHGNNRVRSGSSDIHKVQRKMFHVISFDYRGYGDSTDAQLTDENIVQDCVLFYQWLEEQTTSDIYVWGHSIGSGIATMTLDKLNKMRIQPKGLILETPFTKSTDVILNSKIGKVFSWVPWFEATVLNPVDKNGLGFNVEKSIDQVECPIMFLHAEDDAVIPYKLGRRLYEMAKKERNDTKLIPFYTFKRELGYGHIWICKDPQLLDYIRSFMQLCDES